MNKTLLSLALAMSFSLAAKKNGQPTDATQAPDRKVSITFKNDDAATVKVTIHNAETGKVLGSPSVPGNRSTKLMLQLSTRYVIEANEIGMGDKVPKSGLYNLYLRHEDGTVTIQRSGDALMFAGDNSLEAVAVESRFKPSWANEQ